MHVDFDVNPMYVYLHTIDILGIYIGIKNDRDIANGQWRYIKGPGHERTCSRYASWVRLKMLNSHDMVTGWTVPHLYIDIYSVYV